MTSDVHAQFLIVLKPDQQIFSKWAEEFVIWPFLLPNKWPMEHLNTFLTNGQTTQMMILMPNYQLLW